MRTGIRVASAATLLTLLTACASSAGSRPEPSPRQSESPGTSTSATTLPNAFEVESARTIRECGIRLTVDGDETFTGDPLVALITTNDEGLPPDC